MIVQLLLPLLIFSSSVDAPDSGTLQIRIENIKSKEGMIWVGLYDSQESFLVKEKAILRGYHIPETGSLDVYIDQLKFGTYAVAVFHDENNNGEMDQNLIGIPSEPYAFSKPPKSKWRLPKFEELTIEFKNNGQALKTRLNKWWNS